MLDGGIGFIPLRNQLAVGTVDFEMRDRLETEFLRDRRLPIDVLHAGAIDVDFYHRKVGAFVVENFQLRRDRHARGTVLAVEIEKSGFSRHQIIGEINLGSVGNRQRLRTFIVVGFRERRKRERERTDQGEQKGFHRDNDERSFAFRKFDSLTRDQRFELNFFVENSSDESAIERLTGRGDSSRFDQRQSLSFVAAKGAIE